MTYPFETVLIEGAILLALFIGTAAVVMFPLLLVIWINPDEPDIEAEDFDFIVYRH